MKHEVIAFICEFTGEKPENITETTLVNFELGVDGDDGLEFLEEFLVRFQIPAENITQVYIGPEGFNPLQILKSIFAKHTQPISPLPVSQLIQSAEAGKWVCM